jgi:glutathione peroxidase
MHHVWQGNKKKVHKIISDSILKAPVFLKKKKVTINGEGEHPVFQWLKKELPIPHDDSESLMSDPKFIIWKPVKRSDVAWNFEKFLIGPDGKAVRRYSKSFQTAHIARDIAPLI